MRVSECMETLFKYKTNESNFNEVKTAVEFNDERKGVFCPQLLQVSRKVPNCLTNAAIIEQKAYPQSDEAVAVKAGDFNRTVCD